MKETIKLGIILLIIAGISGGILAFANSQTAPIVEAREREESLAAFGDIFPDAEDFKDLEDGLTEEILENHDGVLEVYEAVDGSGAVLGYAFKAKAGGYGGQVVTALGIESETHQLSGIKVIGHEETPGIGNKIEEESFTDTFKERDIEGGIVATGSPAADNEVQSISGATVSTKAVVGGVNKAIDAYKAFLQ